MSSPQQAKVILPCDNNMTTTMNSPPPSVDGRAVLQPTCNRQVLERRNSMMKKKMRMLSPKTPPPPPPPPPRSSMTKVRASGVPSTTPSSPKLRSPRLPAVKRLGSETTGLTSSVERVNIPKSNSSWKPSPTTLERKKSKRYSSTSSSSTSSGSVENVNYGRVDSNNHNNKLSVVDEGRRLVRSYSSSMITEAPGSIAAVRREQMALQQAQRKLKIAHYGRSKSAKFDSLSSSSRGVALAVANNVDIPNGGCGEEKRCSFITPNSDPVYVAYHDEEWGVPTHDDKKLFELLVMSGAQVGSDWTSILKKRQDFRKAFMEFDAEKIAELSEKQMVSVSTSYNIDLGRVRGVVDNANRIMEVQKEFGSFHKYVWGFVNNKPICPQYKFGHKMPVKTSKSETISKDLIRRGFRSVGPTVVHSFMQAAGLTNDHLLTCHRHLQCTPLPTLPNTNDDVHGDDEQH